MLQRLLTNHVLANLTFALVLVIGFLSYNLLPRQQDPTINFNWIVVTTVLPGAAAEDVERQVTDVLEEAVRTIPDTRFVSSNSRENVSSLLIRFEDIDTRTFDKHVSAIRREIRNVEEDLPALARDPVIVEITSANAFPSVTVAVLGEARDDNLREQAFRTEQDLERLMGVDRVDPIGLQDPELQVQFDPAALQALDLSPMQLADSVNLWFRDLAAGSLEVGETAWLVRLVGRSPQAAELAELPIVGVADPIPLGRIADVVRAREKPAQLSEVEGKPAVIMAVMKQADANTLELVDRVKAYVAERNQVAVQTGVELRVIDDQTIPTRTAISLMQNNALIGLLLVLLVAWLFLGPRIALLTAIGIPFVLAGTFWVLLGLGETLNVVVLLGVVIVLGMLVDDAVVVVEAIHYRLQHGEPPLLAIQLALAEVARPVLSAVLTTMAAFLPLMLLPGILGDFMRVIPMVVTIALAISLVEAFWMLPAHVLVAHPEQKALSRGALRRQRLTRKLQRFYLRRLLSALRRPVLTLGAISLVFVLAVGAVGAGLIKMDFFASDPLRLFYVNIDMPDDTPLERTLAQLREVEARVRAHLAPEEVRAIASYAGQKFTDREPLFGDHFGQILVGLQPKTGEMRSVDQLIEAMRADVEAVPGPLAISFLKLAGGPPVSRPVSVKVRGGDLAQVRAATDALKQLMAEHPAFIDITDDSGGGRMALTLRPDYDAITRAGLNPLEVLRSVQLLVNGEVVADMQHRGQKLEVRVKAQLGEMQDIERLLDFTLPLAQGGQIPLSELVQAERSRTLNNIRHYNFRRAITVEADLAPDTLDTVQANDWLRQQWQQQLRARYPGLDLDFSGELDDIQESLDAIGLLFLLGVGLMYLILGTQFASYFQPLMILATIPMAFTGVVIGLLLTQNPLSLFTLYGVVALAGIAVNAAIVLISAANQRLEGGMSVLHATLYAARRRVVPILITSLTTVAGLFSLATGLGGKSLIWGPVATSIVAGLLVSTLLTLFVIPLLYRLFMRKVPV